MQASFAGRLPVLEGFATTRQVPLDRYERGYYQASVRVTSTVTGGSLVRVSARVTAWYADPVASRSGYALLPSNGRLETDLLDQLSEQLAKSLTDSGGANFAPPSAKTSVAPAEETAISVPVRKFPEAGRTFPGSLSEGLAARENSGERPDDPGAEKRNRVLQAEADSLEEVLESQAHPKNLVAVKKSGTAVVATPSLTAKPEFLAAMHDEFELLDFNADWVHVRISGLSRGWIWRNGVEMPEGIADSDAPVMSNVEPASGLFHVTREQMAPFPGDWEPLRNQNVKIVSVQKSDGSTQDAGPQQRLDYAKFLLEKNYTETAQKPQDTAGIVLIFDSADGGMIAATMATLKQWRSGALPDSALWQKCFFDPPETFASSAPSGSQ